MYKLNNYSNNRFKVILFTIFLFLFFCVLNFSIEFRWPETMSSITVKMSLWSLCVPNIWDEKWLYGSTNGYQLLHILLIVSVKNIYFVFGLAGLDLWTF